ncbi:MAG: TonB family protein [Phycisphaerae bacterium]|nr:TonB family protein [Phycisphaerae bacterium]
MTSDVSLITVMTLTAWSGCAVVAIVGLVFPHAMPQPARAQAPPVTATVMKVDISDAIAAAPIVAPPTPSAEMPPAMASAPTATPAPAEMPSPSIAFPLATKTIAATSAALAQSNGGINASAAGGAIAPLTFGVGEGQQPKPEYPIEAELAGQEGTVTVRFTVGESGRVESAEVIKPCPYPLLNQSALRTIRQQWRFAPGPRIVHDVTIQFTGRKS